VVIQFFFTGNGKLLTLKKRVIERKSFVIWWSIFCSLLCGEELKELLRRLGRYVIKI